MQCFAKNGSQDFFTNYVGRCDFMTDKRNIVIKVSYPAPTKSTDSLAPRMVTEWNVKRIVLAVGVLVLILATLIYSINNDTQKINTDNATQLVDSFEKEATSSDKARETEIINLDIPKRAVAETNSPVNSKHELYKKTTGNQVKGAIKKQANDKVIKEPGYSKANVPRASLTYAINNKEPVTEIGKAVNISHKKSVWLYYFTELKAMNGSKVFHEWLKNGVLVSRQTLAISGDTWRTSSRKLLSDSDKGNWIVRLVDKNGRLLNEKSFKVE